MCVHVSMKAAKPAYSFSLATNPSPTRARSYPLNNNPNLTRNPKVSRDPSGSGRVADLYSDVDPQILWEMTKCAIQGFCISFSSTLAKAKTHQFTQLENKIQSLQNLQKQHFTAQQAT